MRQYTCPACGTVLSPDVALSAREYEVVGHLAQGLTTAEIAARLFLSQKTVQAHYGHIKKKVQVRTLPALIVWAVRFQGKGEMDAG